MVARRWPLRLRNLQTLAELRVEKNTIVMFPSPMMSAIGQISSFRTRETTAAQGITPPPAKAKPSALPAGRRQPTGSRPTARAVGPGHAGIRPLDEWIEIETRTRNTEAVRSQMRDHRVAVVQRIFSGIEFSACRTCTASSLAALSPSLE